MRRLVVIFVMFFAALLLLSESSYAAIIKGSVYNSKLETEQNVLIEVNSLPSQKFLAKDGSYEFELPLGAYVILARKEGITAAENVQIVKEGEFVVDLFLLPEFIDEDELWQDTEEDVVPEQSLAGAANYWLYGAGIAILVITLFLIFLLMFFAKRYVKQDLLKMCLKLKNKLKGNKEERINKEEKEEEKEKLPLTAEQSVLERFESSEKKMLDEILAVLKKSEGRMTQKELRKELGQFSEAKISLMITELEHEGKIKKIKQGRGNIIILKQLNNLP